METVKTTGKGKVETVQADVASEVDTGVAVLEGEIEDVEDYTALLEMQHDPLRVMHKDGREAIEAFPDWHFAWVRNGKDQRRNDVGKMQTLKYLLVTPKSDPDVTVFSFSDEHKGRFDYNELTLMKLPMKYKKQRDAFNSRANARQMQGLGNEFLNDPTNDAYVPAGGTSVTKTRGG